MLHLDNVKTKSITAGQLAQICHAIQYGRGNHDVACDHCAFKFACNNFREIYVKAPYECALPNAVNMWWELESRIDETKLLKNAPSPTIREIAVYCNKRDSCNGCDYRDECNYLVKTKFKDIFFIPACLIDIDGNTINPNERVHI